MGLWMDKLTKCIVCAKDIKQFRSGRRKFCSNACRSEHWRKGEVSFPCYYCGCRATSVDHVPPVSIRPTLMQFGMQKTFPFFEVDACQECNSLLGTRAIWFKSKRKRFIKLALRLRYTKLLHTPRWTEEEIAELGYTLKTTVQSGIALSEWIRQRIAW